MSFWDTSMGHHLADTLIRTLPGIKEALSAVSKPQKRTQHATIIYKEGLEEFLNKEFESGRVLVNVIAMDNVDEHLARFLVVTE